MTDEKQLGRMKQAVEDKNEEARRKNEESPEDAREHGIQDEEPQLHDPAYPQDTRDERAKNSRHGQVTADKWNQ